MKIVYFTFLSFIFLSFYSCSKLDEPALGGTVEVVFKANKMVTNRGQSDEDLSVLTFKSGESGAFSLFSNEVADNTNWVSDENGSLTKKMILPAGIYRFLMARGFSSNLSDENNIIFLKDIGAAGDYDGDYYFKYPSSVNNDRIELKSCSTELYIDSNESGFESNQTTYNLSEGNKFSVSRKVTRLQGRLDFMIRRGEKTDNNPVRPIPEGDDNKDALDNALKKIKSIKVTANNTSTRCHVNGLTCSTPGKYTFEFSKNDFIPFNSEGFVAELKEVEQTDYSIFDNSAYQKGPLLFPAPTSGNGKILLDITIYYESPLQPKEIKQFAVELSRNNVTLVILWLINEKIGIDVTVDQDNLAFEDGTANGDDGFWN